MAQTDLEQANALNQHLFKQNAHLLSVLHQVRDLIDPTIAVAGPNLDAANYALSFVFGPRGGYYGRFCPHGSCQWVDGRNSMIKSGEWCPVCGQVRSGNQTTDTPV